jgi:dephospho-CoA kinase
MLKIAITGPSGSGKTTFASFLKGKGAFIAETDVMFESLLNSDMKLVGKISALLNDTFISPRGKYNRACLEKKLTNNPEKLDAYIKIIGPALEKKAEELLIEAIRNNASFFVLVAPVIMQCRNKKGRMFDYIISMSISKKIQIDRLEKREKTDPHFIEKQIDLDTSESYRHDQADLIIHNDASLLSLASQAKKVHAKLCERLIDLPFQKNIFKAKIFLLTKLLVMGGVFSSSLSHGMLLSPSTSTSTSTSSKVYNAAYLGLQWCFGSDKKIESPQLIIGYKHLKIDSKGDTYGVDMSLGLNLFGPEPSSLSKIRAKYVHGKETAQGEIFTVINHSSVEA